MAAPLHNLNPRPRSRSAPPPLSLVGPARQVRNTDLGPDSGRARPAPSGVSDDAVTDYLRNISRVDLLDAEQEVELARRIEAGVFAAERLDTGTDPATGTEPVTGTDHRAADLRLLVRDGELAMDHLLRANLRLVVSIAKRYTCETMPFSDLIQEGNLGLIRAVHKFDHRKGFKFSTYATWWIRQAITRAIADQSRTIRVPVHMVEMLNRLNRVQRELAQILGREPNLAELAERLGDPPGKVAELRRIVRQPVSLDQPARGDTETTVGDLVADRAVADDAVLAPPLRHRLEELLAGLPEREGYVVRLRCGLFDDTPRSYEYIGRLIGRSRDRVRHIEANALRKLRRSPDLELLRDYLDG